MAWGGLPGSECVKGIQSGDHQGLLPALCEKIPSNLCRGGNIRRLFATRTGL